MDPVRVTWMLWLVWLGTWLVAALWSRRTAQRGSRLKEAPVNLTFFLGFLLLFSHLSIRSPHFTPLWEIAPQGGWAITAVAVFGFVFAWWARLHLGPLWSGRVERKEGHRIVDSGPYGVVRHPIYTGLIGSALATAILFATPTALAGILLITLGLWLKARLEERFLRQELGADTYDSYAARVPMLVPFWPTRATKGSQ